ncbi:hypothetical protein [Thalassobaculum salexigens]|uniref:hypothetical protein n=1 Tax=Thalassobaculum salexigens TaxID=455360 RepID=UPI00248F0CED|nr:hypothetical protein [Thalassobaculum salexigens]
MVVQQAIGRNLDFPQPNDLAEQIDARVARAAAVPVSGPHVFQVVNDDTVETAVARFLAALDAAASLTG